MFKGKDFISCDHWTTEELNTALEWANDLKIRYQNGEITNWLVNQTVFMLFFEQSTRTRNSMEAGITQLGGHAHDLTPDKMQLSHGETAHDTAMVLSRMGEAIASRNCFYNIGNAYLNELARYADIPILSLQDDVYHPMQAIADLMTIQEHFGENTQGLKVTVSWAYATSHAKPVSVPQSQILLFPRYGMDVTVAAPKEFPLQKNIVEKAQENAEKNGGSLRFVDDMDEGVADAQIVFPKNWGGFAYYDDYEDTEEYRAAMKETLEKHKDWILNHKRYELAEKNCKIMHALPADRDKEIVSELLDSENAIIWDEAENRLHTAKAIMALTMGARR